MKHYLPPNDECTGEGSIKDCYSINCLRLLKVNAGYSDSGREILLLPCNHLLMSKQNQQGPLSDLLDEVTVGSESQSKFARDVIAHGNRFIDKGCLAPVSSNDHD